MSQQLTMAEKLARAKAKKGPCQCDRCVHEREEEEELEQVLNYLKETGMSRAFVTNDLPTPPLVFNENGGDFVNTGWASAPPVVWADLPATARAARRPSVPPRSAVAPVRRSWRVRSSRVAARMSFGPPWTTSASPTTTMSKPSN